MLPRCEQAGRHFLLHLRVAVVVVGGQELFDPFDVERLDPARQLNCVRNGERLLQSDFNKVMTHHVAVNHDRELRPNRLPHRPHLLHVGGHARVAIRRAMWERELGTPEAHFLSKVWPCRRRVDGHALFCLPAEEIVDGLIFELAQRVLQHQPVAASFLPILQDLRR